jgi:hypothetical protein
MLKSDALPLSNVRAENPFVLFETTSGLTNVQFQDLSSVADDGCAIGGSSRDARGHAWLVLFPAVLLWARRRKSTVTRLQS